MSCRTASARTWWCRDAARPTAHIGYEARMLREGDEVEFPEADGKRLVEAGVLEEAAKKSKR